MLQLKDKCPTCHSTIHITPEYGICMAIYGLIQQCFPQEYQQRETELKQDKKQAIKHFSIPLLYLGEYFLFPHAVLPLHVFEPRYIELIKRCLVGSRRFGVLPIINQSKGRGSDIFFFLILG